MAKKNKLSPHEHPSPLVPQILWLREDSIALGLLLTFITIIYSLTLSRTVPGGDSGELIAVSANLGIAHPPGYPLYTMLAWLFSKIPIGNVATRINFFSAFCYLAAAFFFYKLVWKLTRDRWATVLATGMFFLSPLIWRYAVVAEVFGLHILLTTIFYFLIHQWFEEKNIKTLYWTSIIIGLNFSHHHTSVFFIFPVLGFVVYKDFARIGWGRLIQFIAIGFAGMLPYLYLPLAALKPQIISWGDFSNWKGFVTHFTRAEYGTFQLAAGKDEATKWYNFYAYSWYSAQQFLVVGVGVWALGIWLWFKKRTESHYYLLIVLSTFGFYTLVFNLLANMDLKNRLHFDIQTRFWQAPNLLLAIFFGIGASWLLSRVKLKKIIPVVVIILIFLQVVLHYKLEDYSENRVFEKAGHSVLDSLPPKALFLVRGDVFVNSVRYLQTVEGVRTDVLAFPFDLMWWPWFKPVFNAAFPDVVMPGKVYRYTKAGMTEFTLKEFFEANWNRYDIFIGRLREDEEKYLKQFFDFWPVGFSNWVRKKDQPIDYEKYKQYEEAFFRIGAITKPGEFRDQSWEAWIYHNYWDVFTRKAQRFFDEAKDHGQDPNLLRIGIEALEYVAKNRPDVDPVVYKNIGVGYQFLAQNQPQARAKLIENWEKFLSFGPTNDPDVPKIELAISKAKAAMGQAPPGKAP